MSLAIDILRSFVIARPRVEIDRGMRRLLEIVANIAVANIALAQSQPTVRSSVTSALQKVVDRRGGDSIAHVEEQVSLHILQSAY